MFTPLLTTKLYIPPARSGLVSRPRLVEQLNQSSGGKLTLISAPAGFGKTMLLSEWTQQNAGGQGHRGAGERFTSAPLAMAWLSLDEGDNDPARFLSYVIAALQTLPANVGVTILSALQSPRPPPLESLLVALVNELMALPDPFVLVLDDYHVIGNRAVHQLLTFLLDHLPSQMHIVIASRVDPPLPLSRLRARGQLVELRAAELRFSLAETVIFLNDVMGLNLSGEDVAALEARTEGWIASLQLAALSMQGHTDLSGFVKAFSGNHRYILAYLTEEVLNQQPEHVQAFLLQTAILEQLTSPLCDAVLGRGVGGKGGKGDETSFSSLPLHLPASSQEILEQLERTNLFTISLDDEGRWYRYHHLFADLLRHRLQRLDPDLLPALHRRASAWYAQAGLTAEAIRHALTAGDIANAAALIEESAMAIVWQGQVSTLTRWLETLPIEVVRARPKLSLVQGWALVLTGSVEAVETRLQDAEQGLASPASSRGRGSTGAGHSPTRPGRPQPERFNPGNQPLPAGAGSPPA